MLTTGGLCRRALRGSTPLATHNLNYALCARPRRSASSILEKAVLHLNEWKRGILSPLPSWDGGQPLKPTPIPRKRLMHKCSSGRGIEPRIVLRQKPPWKSFTCWTDGHHRHDRRVQDARQSIPQNRHEARSAFVKQYACSLVVGESNPESFTD